MIDGAFNDFELQIIGAIVLAGVGRVVKGQRVFLQCPEEEANDSVLKLIVLESEKFSERKKLQKMEKSKKSQNFY